MFCWLQLSDSPDILALYETNLDDWTHSVNFSVTGYLTLIWKDSSSDMHGLAVFVKKGLHFAWDLSLENSPSLSLCIVIDSVPPNIYEVLSINPSANVFVFGDFNIHHKDWLTYSGGTDWSDQLYYNFSLSNYLTQMVTFPTCIPGCDSHTPALLHLFISSDASICSTMDFLPLGNLDYVAVSVSIDFP